MKKSLIAVALAFMSMSTAAHAKPSDGVYLPTLDVFYGDLNLSNTFGARVMLNRIKFAASRVCGGEPSTRLELITWRYYKRCVGDATREGVSQLRAPLVTALYTGQDIADVRIAEGN